MQQSLIRRCRRVVTYGHVLQCSLGFALACSRNVSSQTAAAPLFTKPQSVPSLSLAYSRAAESNVPLHHQLKCISKLLGLELDLFQECFMEIAAAPLPGRIPSKFPSFELGLVQDCIIRVRLPVTTRHLQSILNLQLARCSKASSDAAAV